MVPFWFQFRSFTGPAKDDGESEAIPVAFRNRVLPLRSKVTNIFRPNVLQGEPRAQTLGAVYLGKMEMVPQNKLVDVIWEVPWLLSCWFKDV